MSLEPTRFLPQRLTTRLDWEDLDLPPSTRSRLEELGDWLRHAASVSAPLSKDDRRLGSSALFSGVSGTGKTLAAVLLGNDAGKEVHRVDLSAVVSKYIGETEKNLSALFDVARDKDWILFFDEADALFGKRSEVEDAHGRYANQEVAYLLQRLEEFRGLAILASNLGADLDDALRRRFRFVIEFPRPDKDRRAWIRQRTPRPPYLRR